MGQGRLPRGTTQEQYLELGLLLSHQVPLCEEEKGALLTTGSFVQRTQLGRPHVSWIQSLLTLLAWYPCDISNPQPSIRTWGQPMCITLLGLL